MNQTKELTVTTTVLPASLAADMVVRGRIKFFKTSEGFGFAIVQTASGPVDVFLRKETARRLVRKEATPQADGTYEPAFDITDEEVDCTAHNYRRGETFVTLELEPTKKGGWRARRWGIEPEFTWVDLYLRHPQLLEAFVGGRAELQNSSSSGVGGYTVQIDELELTREQITLSATHRPDTWWPGDEVDRQFRSFERSYPLAPIKCVERGGFMELTWRGDDDSCNRLCLWASSRRQ